MANALQHLYLFYLFLSKLAHSHITR